ncbi:hypothetical protein ACH5RR_006655 [Cinchona calisaya]|uniref:Uncharacterized protein n=1 Tax=Cinchona calisaya TaxID=153742 RepID=A0ABD3AQ12_9GENT
MLVTVDYKLLCCFENNPVREVVSNWCTSCMVLANYSIDLCVYVGGTALALVLVDMPGRTIEIYDSMGRNKEKNAIRQEQLKRVVFKMDEALKFGFANEHKDDLRFDYGVYMMKFMDTCGLDISRRKEHFNFESTCERQRIAFDLAFNDTNVVRNLVIRGVRERQLRK